uniref:Uncharacterized protein n=1 Tax=viral metagenome TaxID=1070528 RepID=A0A6C0AJ34_9ZZZZ
MRLGQQKWEELKFQFPKVRESKELFIIFCDDGWTYIPQIRLRRKFVEDEDVSNEDWILYAEESWEGVIPGKILHEYKAIYTTYETKTLVWMESDTKHKHRYLFVERP